MSKYIVVQDPITGKLVKKEINQLKLEGEEMRAKYEMPASPRSESPISVASSVSASSSPISIGSASEDKLSSTLSSAKEETLFDKVDRLNNMQWNLLVEHVTGNQDISPKKPKSETSLSRMLNNTVADMTPREAEKFLDDFKKAVERSARNIAVDPPIRPVSTPVCKPQGKSGHVR